MLTWRVEDGNYKSARRRRTNTSQHSLHHVPAPSPDAVAVAPRGVVSLSSFPCSCCYSLSMSCRGTPMRTSGQSTVRSSVLVSFFPLPFSTSLGKSGHSQWRNLGLRRAASILGRRVGITVGLPVVYVPRSLGHSDHKRPFLCL